MKWRRVESILLAESAMSGRRQDLALPNSANRPEITRRSYSNRSIQTRRWHLPPATGRCRCRARRLPWRTMRRRSFRGWFLTFVVALHGCTSTKEYRAAIASEDVEVRIRGIKMAADNRDYGAVPLIVDRLEDEDDGVRFYAILALERITGERFGYDYARISRDRAAAVQKWRLFIKRGEHLSAAERPEGGTDREEAENPGA